MTPAAPSTSWREDVAPDETVRFEAHAARLAELQTAVTRKLGRPGRALHRKGHTGAGGTFEVLGGLPEPYASGLFATPKRYRAYVRFSNGGFGHKPDGKPDVRGLGVKLLGVPGKKVIPGLEDAATQDFLAIGNPATPFRNADEFVTAVYAGRSLPLALPRFIRAFGFARAFRILREFSAAVSVDIPTLSQRRFYSALPVRYGAYAAKYAFIPAGTPDGVPGTKRPDHHAQDLADRLARAPIVYDFAVQLYRDEATTPIEDGSVEWSEASAPFVTVGRLVLPVQDVRSPEGVKLTERIEGMSFDPWHALVEHRPLGNMMRARNVAYRVSTQGRKASAEPDASEA